MKSRAVRWVWFVTLCHIDNFLHFLGIDWYWFCQYSGLGWFDVWDKGELLRVGPFLHTWRGWYYKTTPLTKNVVACHYSEWPVIYMWSLWGRLRDLYRHTVGSGRWLDGGAWRYYLRRATRR